MQRYEQIQKCNCNLQPCMYVFCYRRYEWDLHGFFEGLIFVVVDNVVSVFFFLVFIKNKTSNRPFLINLNNEKYIFFLPTFHYIVEGSQGRQHKIPRCAWNNITLMYITDNNRCVRYRWKGYIYDLYNLWYISVFSIIWRLSVAP